jgi:hypothetical protein
MDTSDINFNAEYKLHFKNEEKEKRIVVQSTSSVTKEPDIPNPDVVQEKGPRRSCKYCVKKAVQNLM